MRPVYDELLKKLPRDLAWQTALDRIVFCAAVFNPIKMKEKRTALQESKELLESIAAATDGLRELMEKYYDHSEKHSISTPDYISDPFFLIDSAAAFDDRISYLYEQYIKEKLLFINNFDTRYFPDTEQLLASLSRQIREHVPVSTSLVAPKALSFRKSSAADFYRSLVAALKLYTEPGSGEIIPSNFAFTDKAIANITNCALDLHGANQIEPGNVKAWRSQDMIRDE
jgi:hypothetical protein